MPCVQAKQGVTVSRYYVEACPLGPRRACGYLVKGIQYKVIFEWSPIAKGSLIRVGNDMSQGMWAWSRYIDTFQHSQSPWLRVDF